MHSLWEGLLLEPGAAMTDHPDRPGYSFNDGPPPEVSRFFANKGLQPSFSWADVEPEEHAVAFAVAKAGTVDVLSTIRDEVQRAIDDGLPFREFQRNLQPRLEKLGWWGFGEALDPRDGQRRAARLGTPRRLRTIFDANLRSARAAGQWERIQRTKDALPYLEYRLGPSERHRPHHEAKQGLVLPADDPFWSQWYPPNGWGCKCWVRQLTEAEAQERGISDSPPVPTREWTNRRTGEIKQVPVGIDPGWERNPGRVRQAAMEKLLRDKLAAADPTVARTVARDVATSWRVERMFAGQAPGTVPVAVLSEPVQTALGARTPIVQMRDDVAAKLRRKHPEVGAETLALFVDAIDHGPAAVQTSDRHDTLLFLVPGDKPWLLAIKHLAEKNELWLSTAHRTELRKWRAKLRRPGITVVRE